MNSSAVFRWLTLRPIEIICTSAIYLQMISLVFTSVKSSLLWYNYRVHKMLSSIVTLPFMHCFFFSKFLRYPLLLDLTFLLWCSQKTRTVVLIGLSFFCPFGVAMEKWSQIQPQKNSSFVVPGPGILSPGPAISGFFKELLAFSSNLRQPSSLCHSCPSIYKYAFSWEESLWEASFYEFLYLLHQFLKHVDSWYLKVKDKTLST